MLKSSALASAKAFLKDPKFSILADIALLEHKGSWRVWEDIDGNRLRIQKNKAVKVYPSNRTAQSTKDIFRKAHPSLIAKNSYWVLIIRAKDKSIMSFLGDDGVLRASLFEKKVWKYNFPVLLLGVQALRYISSGYIDNEARLIRSLKISTLEDFKIEDAWATGYPSEDEKLQEHIECHLINQNSKDNK